MTARLCAEIGPEPARSGRRLVSTQGIGSAAGGGWTSHNPTPGGAMEEWGR